MNIQLESRVTGELTAIANQFDVELFKYLLPPGAKLLEFGGSEKGDLVHLKLPVAGEWISEITENGASEGEWYFIDEGRKLPFPLKRWKHRHILRTVENDTIIIDDIHFSTGTVLVDILFYPILFLSFYPRISQYKRYFNR